MLIDHFFPHQTRAAKIIMNNIHPIQYFHLPTSRITFSFKPSNFTIFPSINEQFKLYTSKFSLNSLFPSVGSLFIYLLVISKLLSYVNYPWGHATQRNCSHCSITETLNTCSFIQSCKNIYIYIAK